MLASKIVFHMFKNKLKIINFYASEVEVGSKNRSKINSVRGVCPDTFARCPRTPPGSPQDVPRRPETPQGRPKTAQRPCQDVSKTLPDAPRRLQVGPQRRAKAPKTPPDPRKKRHKSDPKRNPLQISFLERFWADFGRFSDGFGKVLVMILEA